MASYRDRVSQDLDRWIAAGFVAADQRAAILDSIPQARRLEASAALAWVGAVLLSVAVISFMAANWEGLPRLARFAVVLAVYGGGAGAAAWAVHRQRPRLANGLLTFSALVFAGAVGLTGQIFDIAGDPRTALYASGVAALALALAGRSSGAAIVAVIWFGVADFLSEGLFSTRAGSDVPWLLVAAPVAMALALAWRSAALAHVAALGAIATALWLVGHIHPHLTVLLGLSALLAVLAFGGRWLRDKGRAGGGVFYGWFAWAALGFYIAGGWAGTHHLGIVHRLAWLVIAGAMIALGRSDRQAAVTAAGVLGMVGAVAVLLTDLGLNLMASAGLFLIAAVVALGVGLVLRRRAK